MNINIKKTTFIRLVCFIVAAFIVLAGYIFLYQKKYDNTSRILEYQYTKSIDDLLTYSYNIDSDLSKALYSNSPKLLNEISTKIWKETCLAKESLSNLPINYLDLENTNKLLAQLGNFCVSLSRSFEQGTPITSEQRDNLLKLSQYCKNMTEEITVINDEVKIGGLSFHSPEKMMGNQQVASFTNSFADFNEGFTEYPTLIYDGPFSDHLMQKEPELIKNMKEVSPSYALSRAEMASQTNNLQRGEDEQSKMVSYSFNANGVSVCVTKNGGLISYMIKSREVYTKSIDEKSAINFATKYLQSLGIENIEKTYYEIANNVMTINYAAISENIMLYPDLIKVSVAMDNGEIVEFDARGYIVNHKERDIPAVTITSATAQGKLSEFLTPQSTKLALIPLDNLTETLCYEIKCVGDDGQQILVYINAYTGEEERILILLINENGTLTI